MGHFKILNLAVTLSTVYICVTAIEVSANSDAPIIYPNDKELIVTAGNNLNLTCKGIKPLTWKLPENQVSDENEKAFVVIKTAEPSENDGFYGLHLELYNLSAIDVGFYHCIYNDTEENNEADLVDLEAKGEASSIYIFVEDPQTLLVPSDTMIHGMQFKSLTIPCRPTSPDVEVKLYRGDSENNLEMKPNRSLPDDDRIIKYDRHIGFIIPNIGIADATLLYSCEGFLNGMQNESTFVLSVSTLVTSIPKPNINDSFNGRSIVGGKIVLECNIRLNPGIPFSISWKYPNPKAEERLNISVTSTRSINGPNGIPQRMGKSIMTLNDVTSEDEGNYKCIVTLHAQTVTNEVEKTIKVLKKGSSLIKLSEPTNKTELSAKLNKSFNIEVNIDSFPESKITWYHNQKLITSSENYEIITENNRARLQIKRTTLEDRGVYQVKGKSGNAEDTLNFNLTVQSPPEIDLQAQEYYVYGIKHNITCSVKSSPLSKIKWYLEECENSTECKPISQNFKETVPYQKSDVIIEGVIEIFVNSSGKITCSAEYESKKNNVITSNKTSEFFATDIENGFGIVENNNLIVDGDNVSLTCAASIFKYPNEKLNWYKIPENVMIKEEKNDDHIYFRHSTFYSKRFTLKFPNIKKKHAGSYVCRIENALNEVAENQTQILNVTDIESPKIFETNLNNTKISIDLFTQNVEFYCRVKGNPKPTIKWFKNDIPMQVNDRVKISDDGTFLIFTHVKEGDEGKYSCFAQNRVDKTEKYIDISLNYGGFNSIYIIIIVILLIVFLVLISVLTYKIKKEKEIHNKLYQMGLHNFDEGEISGLNPELGIDEQAELLPYDKKWEFPREKLKLGKQLGSGAFGVVMKATADGILKEKESTTVAVKMVKRTADPTLIKALASELKIMVHLGKHLNVVNLLGACTKNVVKRELYVIVEYCRFGNLHNYLIRHRENFIDQIDQNSGNIDHSIGSDVINRAYSVSSNKSSGLKSAMQPLLRRSSISKDDSNMDSPALDTTNTIVSMIPTGDDGPLTSSGSAQPEWRSNYKGDYNYNKDIRPISTQDLLSWSFQIARGMEYLANRKVLHGDLAARNILLAEDSVVKICDFGLAKNMYKNDNYKKKGDSPLPVKWMAIESIRDRVFSTQSDIWSYGIVLWELFSLARTPYPGMEADEIFYNKLVEGYRMEKPPYSNKLIYNVMLECWRAKPNQRPTFMDLVEKLGNLLNDGVRKHYIDLNDPYMDMNNRWLAERGENDYLAMMSAPDYGNLTSANPKHEYVNEPFGGPTRVNPLSPDDTDEEGYLRMTPARNLATSIGSNVFSFPPTSSQKIKSSEHSDQNHEWVPMLKMENEIKRPESDSDIGDSLPTSPNQEKSGITPSFSNPTYRTDLKSTDKKIYPDDLLIVNDNYIDMSNKDSGFCDNVMVDNSLSAFTNPSYISMNSTCQKPFSNIYANVTPNVIT